MRIAFYAPMKPPSHPVPSGDRRMARLLMAALRAAGHDVTVASRLRTWDSGNTPRQARLRRAGSRTAERLINRWSEPTAADRPDLWFTYHLYHKAPDWTGPAVAKALNISYVAAEASYAQKQAKGRWAEGLEATRLALGQAGAVFALSRIDEEGLRAHVQPDRLHRLAPFIDTNQFLGARSACPPDLKADIEALEGPVLLAIGMMRPGDKLASYQILGQALEALMDLPWSLLVVGDGPARSDIEAALPTGRTHFAGALSSDVIPAVIAKTDLMVWPAINEAYGMALLEAQAGGVPVIAGASGGVPEIIADGHTGLLTRPGDPLAFAEAVRALLVDPAKRRSMASAAQQNVRKNHDISSVAAAMNEILPPLARSVATSA